jgi:hypothetical protein
VLTGWVVRPYEGGIWAAVRCRWARLWLGALRQLFGFDAWHAAAPYRCRAYKKVVVELANALHPVLAVEVGCGLGDIISRVTAVDRVGIDTDDRVIRAARFLHRTGRWIHGGAECIALIPAEQRIDCLIMVNWIHAMSPEALAAALLPVLSRTRYLILDAIDPEGPQSYRYKHDFAFLLEWSRQVSTARVPGEPRTLMVFESLR